MLAIEVGDGKTLISSGVDPKTGEASILFSKLEEAREVGSKVQGDTLSDEEVPFFGIVTTNPDSLETLIRSCEHAKLLLLRREG